MWYSRSSGSTSETSSPGPYSQESGPTSQTYLQFPKQRMFPQPLCFLCALPCAGSASPALSAEKALSFPFSFLNSYESNVEPLRLITVFSPTIFVHILCLTRWRISLTLFSAFLGENFIFILHFKFPATLSCPVFSLHFVACFLLYVPCFMYEVASWISLLFCVLNYPSFPEGLCIFPGFLMSCW